MKKIILFVFALSVLVPALAFASFDISLKYGSRGDAVIELQDFLQDQGVYLGTIDGRFGLGTRKAVIAFQKANDLKGDGYFGSGSRAKANSILAIELKPSIDAEQTETVTPVASSLPINTTTTLTITGCTSTSAFSPTTGQPCKKIISSVIPIENTNTKPIPILPPTQTNHVVSFSGGGGSGSSPMVVVGPFPVDPTMPRSISDIQVINITNNSATITWVTKELANGKVSYSISPSFTQIVDCSSGYSPMTGEPCETSISPSSVAMEVVDSTKILNHSLNLNNLIGDTVYYFEVSSVWTNGSVTSTDHSFTTLK